MFGWIKKKRYERDVRVNLLMLFGEVGAYQDHFTAKKLKSMYPDSWDINITFGMTSDLPAELTALFIALNFYKDMFEAGTDEEMEDIRKDILEKNTDLEKTPSMLLLKLKFTTVLASQWTKDKIEWSEFDEFIKQIHIAIFGDDGKHNDVTLEYFLEGGTEIVRWWQETVATCRGE